MRGKVALGPFIGGRGANRVERGHSPPYGPEAELTFSARRLPAIGFASGEFPNSGTRKRAGRLYPPACKPYGLEAEPEADV